MSATSTAAPFTVVYRDDLTAVCPHCDHEITEVYARKRGFPLGGGRSIMFFCPHCRTVLGFGRERMIQGSFEVPRFLGLNGSPTAGAGEPFGLG